MALDIDTRKLKKNAFRVSKERGIGASRIRVPGGYLDARVLGLVQEIAQVYGNGYVHLTTRQGFEIEGIRLEDMAEINEKLQPIIDIIGTNQTDPNTGYPASGTRNISACIGNNVCPFANYNTSALARKIDAAIFPNDLHFKVACTGCSNDCAKVRLHDFGIIGMTMPQYDPTRCVSCEACIKGCRSLSVNALRMENCKVVRDENRCIGCGVCVTKCPTRAMTRSKKKYYKLCIMGRTGKKNPRLAQDWLIWADEENIIKIIRNTYDFVEQYISPDAPARKEHIGYIIDRVGFDEYRKWALKDVELMPETIVKKRLYWTGIDYCEKEMWT